MISKHPLPPRLPSIRHVMSHNVSLCELYIAACTDWLVVLVFVLGVVVCSHLHSGSEAVEAAIKIAQYATGRQNVSSSEAHTTAELSVLWG